MYKLRAQVSVSDASDALGIVWSSDAFDGSAGDPRFADGRLGYRSLAMAGQANALPDGAAAFDALRIAVGVPDLAHDAQSEEVFAGEALLEELHGVDFEKGCFVGQENVSRMKRRATTRKKFCPIEFEGPAPPFGAAITAGDAEIGTVRTGVDDRAIALLRLDRAGEASENGVALAASGREVRLDPPPWLILPSREQG
jgi:folate-binding protein YgfZ